MRRSAAHWLERRVLREQRASGDQEVEALRGTIANSSESLRLQTGELESNSNPAQGRVRVAARVTQLEAAVADYASRIGNTARNCACPARVAEIN